MTAYPPKSSFAPGSDSQAYRKALGRFTTGIAVVTAAGSDGPIGITVNSFASLSLDPALIMWAPDKNSFRHDPFIGAENFAVHVLSSEQRSVCDHFVKNMQSFDGIDAQSNEQSVPIIQDCLAVFECTKAAMHEAGDHTIIIGEVKRVHERDGDALIFQNGVIGVSANIAG
jgi:flavin reductase (DIM6/NTAB) family NADH-FMN oxidoreductase RutF